MERAGIRSIPLLDGWWINPAARIAFNNEAVKDADSRWLGVAVSEKVPLGNFAFYFADGTVMDEDLCDAVLERFHLSGLHADIRRITSAQ
jgi:hypothetical protein